MGLTTAEGIWATSGIGMTKKGNDFTEIEVEIAIKLPGTEQLQHLLTLIQEFPAVRSVEFQ